jgi:hypothetical protein
MEGTVAADKYWWLEGAPAGISKIFGEVTLTKYYLIGKHPLLLISPPAVAWAERCWS